MNDKIKVMLSSKSNEWATPQDLFNNLNKEFIFTLDPCATKENAKCSKFYTIENDGLSKSWHGQTVFMNPPYGRQIGKWIKKAFEEWDAYTTIVCLIPSRTDTAYWHDYIQDLAKVVFIRGRLNFGGSKNNAPFASSIVIFSQ